MNISENGIKFLRTVEGLKLKVYQDSGDEDTIGIGHLLTKAEKSSGKLYIAGQVDPLRYSDGITEEQAYAILYVDTSEIEAAVNANVYCPLKQHQFDALVSFVFNVGVWAFFDSTLLKKLNGLEYGEVPTQLRRWVHCKGKVVKGLVNRREAEIKLWNNEWR